MTPATPGCTVRVYLMVLVGVPRTVYDTGNTVSYTAYVILIRSYYRGYIHNRLNEKLIIRSRQASLAK